MGSFSIHKSFGMSGMPREQLAKRLPKQIDLFFEAVHIKEHFDDGLEFSCRPKAHFELAANSVLRFKMREDAVDLLINSTVGFSWMGALFIGAGYLVTTGGIYSLVHHPSVFLINLVPWAFLVLVYEACIAQQLVKSAFEHMLTSIAFDFS